MTSTERSRLAFVWALWFVALGAAAYLAYHRYNELAGVIPTGAKMCIRDSLNTVGPRPPTWWLRFKVHPLNCWFRAAD